jgi:hypothetical protein
MLTQLVRPMLQTQIRLLANSQTTHPTLVSTVAQWLGFLGVQAQVTHLNADSGKIHISLSVGKPDACDPKDWQKILHNLTATAGKLPVITPHQASQIQRLLAYVIQVGQPQGATGPDWAEILPDLKALGLDEVTLQGIQSALQVPHQLEDLLAGLDADVAAIALPKAVSIAMLDRHVTPEEDQALSSLLQVMKQSRALAQV